MSKVIQLIGGVVQDIGEVRIDGCRAVCVADIWPGATNISVYGSYYYKTGPCAVRPVCRIGGRFLLITH